ncbi:uncharacterized protein METZ01_LOCUS120903 [marine metagenome]|uniref:Uncharacterized protein n=1 Tax=marine metagenome TaxID=408172 RepID=A0A381XTE8_9ZZZZ
MGGPKLRPAVQGVQCPFCGLNIESAERKVCYNRVYPNTPKDHRCARRPARF